MNIKTKKLVNERVLKLESSGELKEVVINEDFLRSDDASVSLCFRGENSSGIVELSPREIEFLNEKLAPKMNLVKNIKIMKFKK